MQNTKAFTLIELLIVVAIIAILATGVIMILNPGERLLDARESTRESHMTTIGDAVHLAVIDCAAGSEDYCANVSSVVAICQTAANDWTLDADRANCQLDDNLDPEDPLSGNPYYIENDGANNVKVWADSSESAWYCDWNASTTSCDGATYKRF
jgi:prepilin-type N-terminal cleavage/methylation domain-containing protein